MFAPDVKNKSGGRKFDVQMAFGVTAARHRHHSGMEKQSSPKRLTYIMRLRAITSNVIIYNQIEQLTASKVFLTLNSGALASMLT